MCPGKSGLFNRGSGSLHAGRRPRAIDQRCQCRSNGERGHDLESASQAWTPRANEVPRFYPVESSSLLDRFNARDARTSQPRTVLRNNLRSIHLHSECQVSDCQFHFVAAASLDEVNTRARAASRSQRGVRQYDEEVEKAAAKLMRSRLQKTSCPVYAARRTRDNCSERMWPKAQINCTANYRRLLRASQRCP